MIKLKTPGVITMSEYHQAKIASQFTIATSIVCCYCQEPVQINSAGPETLLDCQEHGTMRLEVLDKVFYLQRLNGRLLDEEAPSDIVENKGCPFCRSCLEIGETHIYETLPENQVLRYPLRCRSCDISFYVVAHDGVLRLKPKPEHLQLFYDDEVSEGEVSETVFSETSSSDGRASVREGFQTDGNGLRVSASLANQASPPDTIFSDNNSQTNPSQGASTKKGKHVKKQILRVLRRNAVPTKRNEIQKQVDGNVVKPLRELVRDGRLVQPRGGWYALP